MRKIGTDSTISKCNSISISANNHIEDPSEEKDIESNDNEENEESNNEDLKIKERTQKNKGRAGFFN